MPTDSSDATIISVGSAEEMVRGEVVEGEVRVEGRRMWKESRWGGVRGGEG